MKFFFKIQVVTPAFPSNRSTPFTGIDPSNESLRFSGILALFSNEKLIISGVMALVPGQFHYAGMNVCFQGWR